MLRLLTLKVKEHKYKGYLAGINKYFLSIR
jgi:hypothetical protein